MKRNFLFFAIVWAIILASFNAVVFLVRPLIPIYETAFDANFWIVWSFITAAFLGNFVCGFFALRENSPTKSFYNLPLVIVSWSALFGMLLIGCLLLLIPGIPVWIAALACIIELSYDSIPVVYAAWAAEAAKSVEKKTESKIAFVKDLTVDAENIFSQAKSGGVKTECKKVYEAARYSDPTSNEDLTEIEKKITEKMDDLFTAVEADDEDKTKEIAQGLIAMIGERNRKCRALK